MTKTEKFFIILLKTVAQAFFYLRRKKTLRLNFKDSIGYVSCYRIIKKFSEKIRKQKQEQARAKGLQSKISSIKKGLFSRFGYGKMRIKMAKCTFIERILF